ncbi:MAG: hypothetical protein WCI17_08990 [bacterium]
MQSTGEQAVDRALIFDFDGVLAESLPALFAALRRHLEASAGAYRLWPGVPEVLASLARTSAIFVVTSGIASVVAGVLQRQDVACVRQILGAEEGASKVEKIGRAAAACPGRPFFYIGDTRGDILERRLAGATTVAAAWGWHDAPRLRAVRPDHLLFAPAELLALFLKGARQST